MKVHPGAPFPLGATYGGAGTNFSLFSEVAERVELCLFDAQGQETRIELPEVTAFCWHGYLPNVVPGLDPRGERVADDSFHVLFNVHHEPLAFRLPARPDWGERWAIVFDTAQDGLQETKETFAPGGEVRVEGGRWWC